MKIYSTQEAAEKLDIHPRTVLKLINKGELPAKKVANKWRITENQLKQYLEKPDLATDFLNIIDEETKELFGKKEAKKLRNKINKKLKEKGLKSVDWNKK